MSLILLYHRIAELDRDPQLLAVSPGHFAEQLQVLRETLRPISLSELTDGLIAGETDDQSAAVTFDDGYADNALTAVPILVRGRVPATFFIATAAIGTTVEFFWDDLERILLTPNLLPERLAMTIGASRVEASLDSARSLDSQGEWNVLEPSNPTSRHEVYRKLCAAFQNATIDQRRDALQQIHEWARVPAAGRASHRAMTAKELFDLSMTPGIEIGAHTVNHPRLAREAVEDQRLEIGESRDELAKLLRRPIRGFSYPFGTHDAFTPDTIRTVRGLGFEFACANFPRRVGPGTDPFRLPRFVVRDWPGEEFRRRLKEWMAAPIAY